MAEDCPFCQIVKNKERTLAEGKYAYVIFSNPRLMPGHLLVIPKRHIEGKLGELKQEERKEIFDLLVKFQNKILDKIARGCDVRQNYKPFVKESSTHVEHMHFHLQPRELNDEMYEQVDSYRKPLYRDLPDEERDRLFRLLT